MSPSVYIIWMIVFAYSMEQSLSTWSFSGSGGPSGVIQYSIDVQETVTYMRIGSGIDNWFSIGFGGSTMTNIYMLVFGYETSSDSVPVTMDFYSSGHSEGTQQKECSSSTCSTLLGYSFANGRADINVSIPHNSAYSKTFNFGDTLTASYQLDLIFAIGRQSSLVYPGSTGHAAGGWTTASHINAVTNDAEYKELSKTQIGAGSGIYLELKLYQSTSTMVWTMYGPSTQWFAIGWGPHTNADALVYCTDGSTVAAYDYHLQGTSLVGVTEDTQSWNILSDSIVSNERVINATRSFDTGDASDLVFDMTVDSMQFRAATKSGAGGGKPGSEFEIANHQQNRWLETVTFESPGFSATPTRDPITANPSSTPTAQPTNYIAPNVTIKTFPKSTLGTDIALQMKKYESTGIFEVELYGPIGSWFGVAFGSHTAGNALIYSTDFDGLDTAGVNVDWSLKGQTEALVMKDTEQNWNVTEIAQVNGQQKIIAQRAFATSDPSDRTLKYDPNDITVLVARSASNSLQMAYHGVGNAWEHVITFQAGEDVTSAPTISPGSAAPTTAQPTTFIAPNITTKTYPKTTVGQDILLAMKKYETTAILEVELHGPIGSWFGVAFGSHFESNALIYTTGHDGLATAGQKPDWVLDGQDESNVFEDTTQDWNVTDISAVNGLQRMVATRALNDYASNSMTVLVAKSADNSLQMADHGANKWKRVIVFEAGENVTSAPTAKPITAAPTTAQPTTYIATDVTSKTLPKTEISGGSDGDALIYTTGFGGADTAGEEPDYTLSGKIENRISKDEQQDWTVTEVSQVDGVQKIAAFKALDEYNQYSVNTINILVAHGEQNTLNFGYHGHHGTTWSTKIDFESGTAVTTTTTTTTSTTVRPTHDIPENVTVKTFPTEEVGYDSGILLGITMYQTTAIFEIELYGPTDRWFGIAFGSHTAGDAFIYTTAWDGTDTAGVSPHWSLNGQVVSMIEKEDQQNWNVTLIEVVDGQQHIVAHRATFINYSWNTIDVLIAHAETSTLQFAYHGTWCWATTLDFESGTSSVTTTALTTTDEDDQSDDDEVDEMVFELTEIADSDGIFIGASMRKSTATYTLTLHGPSDGWFGVLWEDHYAGDAFIWLNDGEPDYRASGKEVEHIVKDTIQSWTIVESVEEDGMIEIVATRALDSEDAEHDYPFDYDKKKQYILVARSADHSYDLADHGVNRWSTVLDFESGELQLTDSSSSVFWTINHAVFMLLGFGFMIPCAVALFRYQLVFAKWMSSYFMIIPIGESALVLGTVAGLIGLLEKIAEIYPDADHTFSYHSYGGFALITLWILFMLMYYICTTKRAVSKKDTWFNLVVSIAIVCMSFAQILSGIVFSQTPTAYAVAFCVYAAIYGTMFIVLQIYWTKTQDGLEQVGSSRMMLMQIVNGDETKDNNLNKL